MMDNVYEWKFAQKEFTQSFCNRIGCPESLKEQYRCNNCIRTTHLGLAPKRFRNLVNILKE